MIPLVDEMTEEVNVSVIFYLAYFNLWTYKGGGWEGLMPLSAIHNVSLFLERIYYQQVLFSVALQNHLDINLRSGSIFVSLSETLGEYESDTKIQPDRRLLRHVLVK